MSDSVPVRLRPLSDQLRKEGFTDWERFDNIKIEVRKRQSGRTAGNLDPYYWVPLGNGRQHKCRSRRKVFELLLPNSTDHTKLKKTNVVSSHRKDQARLNTRPRCKQWFYKPTLPTEGCTLYQVVCGQLEAEFFYSARQSQSGHSEFNYFVRKDDTSMSGTGLEELAGRGDARNWRYSIFIPELNKTVKDLTDHILSSSRDTSRDVSQNQGHIEATSTSSLMDDIASLEQLLNI